MFILMMEMISWGDTVLSSIIRTLARCLAHLSVSVVNVFQFKFVSVSSVVVLIRVSSRRFVFIPGNLLMLMKASVSY